MTFDITLMRPGGAYSAGISKISAANMNYITASLANALDPIGGGTYTNTAGTQIILDGDKGFRFDYSAGPGLEIAGSVGASILNGSFLTVDLGGTVAFTSGSMLDGSTIATLTLENGSTVTWASGANAVYAAGSSTIFAGDILISSAAVLVNSTGEITFGNGSALTLANGSVVTGEAGSTIHVDGAQNIRTGATWAVQSGGIAQIESGGILRLMGTVTPTYDSARTFARVATHVPGFDTASWDEGYFATPVNGYYSSTSVAGASNDRIAFPIDPPDACTITAVSVWTDPPGGHAGEPAVKTTLELYEQDVATGAAITQVFTLQDPTTVAGGTYEPAHAVTQSGLTTVVDKSTKTYFVVVIPESGANAIVGTRIYPPRFTCTRGKLGEE